MFGIALLMASRVPHFSGKSVGRVPREYVAVVLIALAAALLTVAYYPLEALVALSLAYLGTIPFSVRSVFVGCRAKTADLGLKVARFRDKGGAASRGSLERFGCLGSRRRGGKPSVCGRRRFPGDDRKAPMVERRNCSSFRIRRGVAAERDFPGQTRKTNTR